MLEGKRIVLIISGGIAAYKALDLIRRLKERGARVLPVMTNGAQQFITPLAAGALSAETVYTDLFDREAEHDVGHIRLARDNDLILVAPATADLMAKMAHGLADDLATAVLLATDKPVLIAPAMNPKMWSHPATQRNLKTLQGDGLHFVGPDQGEMAERGEAGVGRMSDPSAIADAAAKLLSGAGPEASHPKPLHGRHVVITSGPTHEPIDPVRYIANRSSGKQGHAIAAAAAAAGATVTLISGPVTVPDPEGRDDHSRGIGPRDAPGGQERAPRRCRHHGSRRCRLALRNGCGPENQEGRHRRPAAAPARRKPGYSGDHRAS